MEECRDYTNMSMSIDMTMSEYEYECESVLECKPDWEYKYYENKRVWGYFLTNK